MGVEMRVHVFFPLLAVVCVGLSASDGGANALFRGMGLFLVWWPQCWCARLPA